MSSRRKNLIISTTGRDFSSHKQWLKKDRSYDLMLVNFSKSKGLNKEDCEFYIEKIGFKLEIIYHAIKTYYEDVIKYDYIWLPDDDLEINQKDVEKLFKLFRDYKLDLAQPAVVNKNINFQISRKREGCILRYVNFVEMMCPIFTKDSLLEVLETFIATRSGWGVDFIWQKELRSKKIAIIDEISVIHRKASDHKDGEYYKKLRSLNINPQQELDEVIKKLNIKLNWRRHNHKVFKTIHSSYFRYLSSEAQYWFKRIIEKILEKIRL